MARQRSSLIPIGKANDNTDRLRFRWSVLLKSEWLPVISRSCQRRALRWAGMGFVVSIGTPLGSSGETSGSAVDKKKAKAEAAAKKKNLELLKTDPPR